MVKFERFSYSWKKIHHITIWHGESARLLSKHGGIVLKYIDAYELFYRNIKLSEKSNIEFDKNTELPKKNDELDLGRSKSTREIVFEILNELEFVTAQVTMKTSFIKNANRLRNFDINKLKLIDVAKCLQIRVLK